MAKRVKKPETVVRKFESTREHKTLVPNSSFVYEVTIFKFVSRSYNLEDSKTLASKTHSKDVVEYFTKSDIKFKREVTLVAAPESWLKENSYLEIIKENKDV